ncbi:terpene synthase family protein [Pseudomonas sp. COR18]|uniref:terpene synthase family protein n=1 Tax=Pseudomonas sp. COR18 TaxID=3399680 RepID=UPI003B00773F
MPAFELPTLSLPFPACINPHHDAVNESCRSWFISMEFEDQEGVLREYESVRCCELMARGFPCIGPTELGNLTTLGFWMFMLDDSVDQGPMSMPHTAARQHLDRVFSLISGARDKSSSLTKLEESGVILVSRILDEMTPVGRVRLLDDIRTLFDRVTHQVETSSRFPDKVPDLLSIARHRRIASAALVTFRLGEYAHHAELPEAFYRSILFEALQDSAADVVTMINDLYSYEKEHQHLEIHNYVVACQDLLGGTLDEAVTFLVRLLNSRVRCFQQARERLPELIRTQAFSTGEQHAIQLYVQMLEHWMRGNLDWSEKVPRYNAIRQQQSR